MKKLLSSPCCCSSSLGRSTPMVAVFRNSSCPLLKKRSFHYSCPSRQQPQGFKFEGTQLVRDFIHDSLYNPEYGYFNKSHELIISHPLFEGKNVSETQSTFEVFEESLLNNTLPREEQTIVPFTELEDHLDYLENLSELYQRGPQSWGTPIEIFQPYYGIAVAEHILKTQYGSFKNQSLDKTLKIYEMGGGMGTCCRNILDYLETDYPEIYKNTEYHIIEISSQLHEQQKIRCAHHVNNGKLKLHHESFMDWKQVEQDECHIIAMEVLDNCAHDKIAIDADGNIKECHVFFDKGKNYYEEVFLDCRDELIIRYLNLAGIIESGSSKSKFSPNFTYSSIQDKTRGTFTKLIQSFSSKSTNGMRSVLMNSIGGDHVFYIPTVQLQIVEKLQQNFPKHHFICADFDYLGTDESGESNRPLVQKKFKFMKTSNLLRKIREKRTLFLKPEDITSEDNFSIESHAFRSYLVPKGECDIFFATDFNSMQQVYSKVCQDHDGLRGSLVMKSAQFMKEYAEYDNFTTKSGYNPLLKDYTNFSFFLS